MPDFATQALNKKKAYEGLYKAIVKRVLGTVTYTYLYCIRMSPLSQ